MSFEDLAELDLSSFQIEIEDYDICRYCMNYKKCESKKILHHNEYGQIEYAQNLKLIMAKYLIFKKFKIDTSEFSYKAQACANWIQKKMAGICDFRWNYKTISYSGDSFTDKRRTRTNEYYSLKNKFKFLKYINVKNKLLKSDNSINFIGVYFLIDEKNKIVYVGQTKAGMSRIISHKQDKTFQEYKYLPCEEKYLNIIEAFFIGKFKPKYNKRIPYVGFEKMWWPSLYL